MSVSRPRRSRASICYKEQLNDSEDGKTPPETPKKTKSRKKLEDDESFHLDVSDPHLSDEAKSEDTKIVLHYYNASKSEKVEEKNEMPENEKTPKKTHSRLKSKIESPVKRPLNENHDLINSPTVFSKGCNISSPKASDKTKKTEQLQVTPRRGIRVRKKSAMALIIEKEQKNTEKVSLEESEEEFDKHTHIKPTTLFAEDDVEGKKMFGFKTSHKKHDLLKKASESLLESPKTPLRTILNSPSTPKSALKSTTNTPKRKVRLSFADTPKKAASQLNIPKTPHSIRNRIQKELKTIVQSDSEGSDFSADSSDYMPSESEDDNEITDEESNSDEEQNSFKQSIKEKTTSKQYNLRNVRGEKDGNFVMKPDDYFAMHGSKKIVTSNRTLDRLKNPRLTKEKVEDILKDHSLSKEHRISIKELIEDYKKLFDKWMFLLSEGFSILLHGVGSKIKLLQEFQNSKLTPYPCIVINGFYPSLTLKDILQSIIIDMLELPSTPSNIYDAVNLIENEIASYCNVHMFLIVHNIDGAMLRNNKFQYVLSKLAKVENVHLIASVDHINSSLYWDHVKLKDLNFSWWDVTTFIPYTQETSFETSLLVDKSGTLVLSSLKNVFNSLTSNAKGIFMLIVKYQLDNKKSAHFSGISFKDLYWSARENFLVSSDLALRAQLTEFIDHKLIKQKRVLDGIENLIIPIDNKLLYQFVEEKDE